MPPMCMTAACLAAVSAARIGEPAATDLTSPQDTSTRDGRDDADTPRRRIPRWLVLELGLDQKS